MINLLDGPAAHAYVVRRAPLYLRAVDGPDGLDVLDQLTDGPTQSEAVYVYELVPNTHGVMIICGSHGMGGRFAVGDYRYRPDVDGETVRSTEAWRAWCVSHFGVGVGADA